MARGHIPKRMFKEVDVFIRRPTRRLATIIAAVVAAIAMSPAAPAHAYSGYGAAVYAENWWNGRNPNYMTYLNDDCADFVSQSMHSGGGFSYVGQWGSQTDDNLWWAAWSSTPPGSFFWSHSFTVVPDLWNFLLWHYPGGYPQGTAHTYAEQTATYTPATVVTGDLIFYDWNSNGSYDHVAIQVGSGPDPNSGWYGNFIDEHSNNRQHAFWSLVPYNSQWPSATIGFMHIDAGNN